ncbi:unnamed protein product [Chondrus crispus]|uniref:Uncharacterized protein n=1 Tax=Chondrus crispus TaxID=2769 RepID=R7QB22_CHOCR|nr:unnamed protein product [Chondrus crispus]CDF34660.1 unnamed protein product [Chondrus crispus]|eukprot:XP_005714479.1 unnamed protein product [Chondrus crispus]
MIIAKPHRRGLEFIEQTVKGSIKNERLWGNLCLGRSKVTIKYVFK